MRNLLALAFALITALSLTCCDDPDNGSTPYITIDDAEISEGGMLSFYLYVSEPASNRVTVRYYTEPLTADETDYLSLINYQVDFLAGDTIAKINVGTISDDVAEYDETMMLILAAAVNAELQDTLAIGTILNDDDGDVVDEDAVSFTATLGSASWEADTETTDIPLGLSSNILRALGTDGTSLITITFNSAPTATETYGTDASPSDENVVITFTEDYTNSSAAIFTSISGGSLVITEIDTDNSTVSGSFSCTLEDEDENSLVISNGAFQVPIL